jgi:hypothetical protein
MSRRDERIKKLRQAMGLDKPAADERVRVVVYTPTRVREIGWYAAEAEAIADAVANVRNLHPDFFATLAPFRDEAEGEDFIRWDQARLIAEADAEIELAEQVAYQSGDPSKPLWMTPARKINVAAPEPPRPVASAADIAAFAAMKSNVFNRPTTH